MKIAHSMLEKPIEFEENVVNVLVVENPKMFSTVISDFYKQIENNEEGSFVLSEDSKILSMQKCLNIILEPFTVDLNQKKVINKLYSKLKEKSVESEMYKETTELQSNIFTYIEKISDTVEYPLVYDSSGIDFQDIFKMVDLKLESNHESLPEKLLDYMTAVHEFLGISYFITVNLKSFLTFEDLEELYKGIQYKKLNLFLLENKTQEKNSSVEKLYILDSDLCSIY